MPDGPASDAAGSRPDVPVGPDAARVITSVLPDLSERRLADIDTSGDSVLAHALRRVVQDVEHPDGPEVAGFGSAIA